MTQRFRSMNPVAVLPVLRSPRHVDLNDRVGLLEWSFVEDELGHPVGMQCTLKYGAAGSPCKVCVGAALDLPEKLWNVIEQDAVIEALRETLADPTQDVPVFGFKAH